LEGYLTARSRDFLNSLYAPDVDISGVLGWIANMKRTVKVDIQKIPFSKLEKWTYNVGLDSIRHESNRFFSIEGYKICTDYTGGKTWCQPMINQPEIGILGILAKVINGKMHFLLQAKIEPGNINFIQLSPTIQATKSNYTKVHKGLAPRYLEQFIDYDYHNCIVSQIQSEQGSRFLRKRNMNIILLTNERIIENENYIWLTFSQILNLMKLDNIVNMDTRTVFACFPIENYLEDTDSGLGITRFFKKTKNDNEVIELVLKKISKYKSIYNFRIDKTPMHTMDEWEFTEDEIRRIDRKHFKVIASSVEIQNREVTHWTQPMIESTQYGLFAFIIKEENDLIYFLVHIKYEAGIFDNFELAPTVQCSPDNYQKGENVFLDYVLNAKEEQIVQSSVQSEEGGRFFREENKYLIVKASDDFDIPIPEAYQWLTLRQIKYFIRFNNMVNIQARSLISMIDYRQQLYE